MSHSFPPPEPLNPVVVTLHVVLFGVIAVSMARTWRQLQNPDGSMPFKPFVLSGLLVLTFGLSAAARTDIQAFLICCHTLTGLIAVIGWGHSRMNSVNWPQRWLTTVAVLLSASTAVAILAPMTGQASEAANRTRCRNNLKEIALLMHAGYDESGRFPDAFKSDSDEPPVSWRVSLLDYSDGGNLKHPYNQVHTWDSDANLPSAQEQVNLYACPSNYYPADDLGRHYTAYALMTGDDAGFPEGRGLSVKDIPSTTCTIAVVESCGHGIVWTEPRDVLQANCQLELTSRAVSLEPPMAGFRPTTVAGPMLGCSTVQYSFFQKISNLPYCGHS